MECHICNKCIHIQCLYIAISLAIVCEMRIYRFVRKRAEDYNDDDDMDDDNVLLTHICIVIQVKQMMNIFNQAFFFVHYCPNTLILNITLSILFEALKLICLFFICHRS